MKIILNKRQMFQKEILIITCSMSYGQLYFSIPFTADADLKLAV